MFGPYLIASPTLNNDFARILTDAPTKLRTQYDGMKFLYMAIGKHSYEKTHIESFKQFENDLAKQINTQLSWHSNNSEDHYYMSRL